MRREARVTCSSCGDVSTYPPDLAGTTQDCQHCGELVDVPTDDDAFGLRIREDSQAADDAEADSVSDDPGDGSTIVLLCPFCDEHAEFDASAACTTQPCPHCGEELDVLGSLVSEPGSGEVVFLRCEWCKQAFQAGADAVEVGCECPHCRAPNDTEDVAKNRLTTGQAERLGLLRDREPES